MNAPAPDPEVVLVTGSSRGLGRETALAFAAHGAAVLIHYRSRRDAAEQTLADVQALGAEAILCQADLRDPPQAKGLVQAAVERWGRLDGLVNNAAVVPLAPLTRTTEAMWDEAMRTNFLGAVYCLQAAVEVMPGGHVTNLSSILGLRGGVGIGAYATSKGALIGLTKSAAVALGPRRIRVNAVIPGYMPTETGAASPEAMAQARQENPLKMLSDPQQVARFIVQLTRLEHVTGQVFCLEGRLSQ
jgi:3-oxoacyl-[acyl-carrier protein] reductase